MAAASDTVAGEVELLDAAVSGLLAGVGIGWGADADEPITATCDTEHPESCEACD